MHGLEKSFQSKIWRLEYYVPQSLHDPPPEEIFIVINSKIPE